MVGRELLLTLRPAGEDHQGARRVWGDTTRGDRTTCIGFKNWIATTRRVALY